MVNICYGCGTPLEFNDTTKYWVCPYCGLHQNTPLMQGGYNDDRGTGGDYIATNRILGV